MKQNEINGTELIFGITETGNCISDSLVGSEESLIQSDISTIRKYYKMSISSSVPRQPGPIYHRTSFYMPDQTPMSFYIEDSGQVDISPLVKRNSRDSQKWHYLDIDKIEIRKGWITIDGVDVFDITKEIVKETRTKKNSKRKQKFQELAGIVHMKYGSKIFSEAKKNKKQVLGTLKVLVKTDNLKDEEILQALKLTKDPTVLYNLFQLILGEVDKKKVAKIACKANAWNYIRNVFQNTYFEGHFDSVKKALQLYSEN